MSYKFDRSTEKLLTQQGWYIDRKIDTTKYKASWKRDGYTISQAAVQFCESMGGLKIRHQAYRAKDEKDNSEFDPIDAMNKLDSLWVFEEYENIAGSKLCPVGLGFSKHMTYLISEKGEMYGGYDSFFCLIGTTVEEALKNIFFLREFTTLNE